MKDLSKAVCSYAALRKAFVQLFNAATKEQVAQAFVDNRSIGYGNLAAMLMKEGTPLSKLTDDAPAIEKELLIVAEGGPESNAVAAMFIGTSLEAEAKAMLEVARAAKAAKAEADKAADAKQAKPAKPATVNAGGRGKGAMVVK